MDSLLSLTAGRFTAGIAPRLGGSLLYFATASDPLVDFVRPAPARALAERAVRATAGYPLVPYSNRIGDGRFRFDGLDVALATNTDVSPHPLHGVGFLRAWDVTAATTSRIALAFAHVPVDRADNAWPWAFGATQVFDLDERRLAWTLAVTNRDARPMPAGIGMHPFFPKSPRMEVRFAATGVWRNDERMLPVSRTPVPAEWNFAVRRPVGDLAVDNCFAGWSHSAEIAWPDRGWTLAIDADRPFGHLVVFTSPARDSVAIEPISHANNAVNLVARYDDTGLVVLAPGETLSGTFTMTPQPMA